MHSLVFLLKLKHGTSVLQPFLMALIQAARCLLYVSALNAVSFFSYLSHAHSQLLKQIKQSFFAVVNVLMLILLAKSYAADDHLCAMQE